MADLIDDQQQGMEQGMDTLEADIQDRLHILALLGMELVADLVVALILGIQVKQISGNRNASSRIICIRERTPLRFFTFARDLGLSRDATHRDGTNSLADDEKSKWRPTLNPWLHKYEITHFLISIHGTDPQPYPQPYFDICNHCGNAYSMGDVLVAPW